MKTIIIVLFMSIGFITKGFGQVLTLDPSLTTAVTVANNAENKEYNSIKSNQNAIKTAQAATTAIVSQINTIQNKLYNGLQQVSSVVKGLYQVKEIASLLSDILSYEADMIAEAKKNPIALAFGLAVQKEMVDKAIAYSTDVSAFVLKAGNKTLMDAGERARLLNKLVLDMQTLKALAAYSYYKVHFAVMQGILNSLNPFKGYINLDKQIVNNLLSNWKH